MQFIEKDAFEAGEASRIEAQSGANAGAEELCAIVSGCDGWSHGHTGRPNRAVHSWTGLT